YNIYLCLRSKFPHFVHQERGGEYLTRIAHEKLHELILLVVQAHLAAGSSENILIAVKFHTAETQCRRHISSASAHERSYTSKKLARGKGLGQIIVCSCVKPGYSILYLSLC